jgi:hypothetical protein
VSTTRHTHTIVIIRVPVMNTYLNGFSEPLTASFVMKRERFARGVVFLSDVGKGDGNTF